MIITVEKYFANLFSWFTLFGIIYFIFCYAELKLQGAKVNTSFHYAYITSKDGINEYIPFPLKGRKIEMSVGEKLTLGLLKWNEKTIYVLNERILKLNEGSETLLFQNRRSHEKNEATLIDIYYQVPVGYKNGCGNEFMTKTYVTIKYNLLTFLFPELKEIRNGLNICIN